MKKFKLFLEISFFVFLSSILISFTTSSKSNTTPKVVNTYTTVIKDSKSILVAANIKDFLGKSINESNTTYLEFNIDINQDHKEDFVIHAISEKGRIYFYGPFGMKNTNNSFENKNQLIGSVIITPLNSEPITFVKDEIYLYAGMKQIETPSFLDFITATFSTSNVVGNQEVMTIAFKLPNEILVETDAINTWVSVKKK